MKIQQIIALDYDRTLTLDDLVVPPETMKVLGEVHKKNLAKLAIVSGRALPFLEFFNQSVSRAFSFLVAENGAIVFDAESNTKEIFGEDWSQKAKKAFVGSDFEVRFGKVIGTSSVENIVKIKRALEISGIETSIELNRDSMMLLPPGVSKGFGLTKLISRFGERQDIEVTGFGDGENDFSLFEVSDIRVAVSNAVDQLKKIADVVTELPGGLGVEEYIRKKFMV